MLRNLTQQEIVDQANRLRRRSQEFKDAPPPNFDKGDIVRVIDPDYDWEYLEENPTIVTCAKYDTYHKRWEYEIAGDVDSEPFEAGQLELVPDSQIENAMYGSQIEVIPVKVQTKALKTWELLKIDPDFDLWDADFDFILINPDGDKYQGVVVDHDEDYDWVYDVSMFKQEIDAAIAQTANSKSGKTN
jgi:hypothetical protein